MMHGQKNIKLNFSFRFQHLTVKSITTEMFVNWRNHLLIFKYTADLFGYFLLPSAHTLLTVW